MLKETFQELYYQKVALEGMVLKPSMVLPGKETPPKAAPEVVARATLEVLKRTVPAAVPTIGSSNNPCINSTNNQYITNSGMSNYVWNISRRVDCEMVGTVPWYPEMRNHRVARGRFFTDADMEASASVCVLGADMAQALFPLDLPLGRDVRVGGISLVANYRTEFDNLIRDSGVEGLIKALVAKNSSPACCQVTSSLFASVLDWMRIRAAIFSSAFNSSRLLKLAK